jgi:hypothetical protein
MFPEPYTHVSIQKGNKLHEMERYTLILAPATMYNINIYFLRIGPCISQNRTSYRLSRIAQRWHSKSCILKVFGSTLRTLITIFEISLDYHQFVKANARIV